MGRLSLCVIAKDEESMLPGLLASVEGVVDEIVLVDTGSSDATVDIARRSGAVVVSHPWSDNFAEARNRALLESSGEWILVLDCDERLAPGAGEAIWAAIDQNELELGMLPLFNATRSDATAQEILSGEARTDAPTLLPRLMRRDNDLKWEGRVHESVTDWLAIGEKRVVKVSAPILHLGNAADVVAAKDKLNRNLRLLKQRCQEEPDNPVMWSHLSRVSLRAGLTQEAWDAAKCGWAAQQRQVAAGCTWYSAAPVVTVFCFLALQRGEAALSLHALDAAKSWEVVHPNLSLLRGVSHETLALKASGPIRGQHLRKACEAFEQAIELGNRTWTEDCMPGATDWAALTRLGTARLLLDEWQSAEQAFSLAISVKPDHLEAHLGGAESLLGQGRAQAALKMLEPLLECGGADAWILAGFACRNVGQVEDCRLFLQQAERLLGSGLLAPHRRQYLELLKADLARLAV